MNQRLYVKSFSLFLLLAVCLFFSMPVCAAQQEGKDGRIAANVTKKNPDMKVEAVCGLDGLVVQNKPLMLAVTVESSRDFTGSIRVIPTMDLRQRVIAHAEEISLAKGEAKTFRFTVLSLGGMGKFELQILDEKEKLVYAETDRVTMSNTGSSVMMGILSDDYAALNYFDGVPLAFSNYQGRISTVELTTASFPESSGALSALHYMVIDNYDTANLSEGQYQALKEWVRNGGALIVALGANYQNVLHLFTDDFLSGTLGTMTKKDLKWDMMPVLEPFGLAGEMAQEESGVSRTETDAGLALSNVDCMEFELEDGQETAFSSARSAYRKEMGYGTVVVLSYALGMEPMASYSGRKDVAELLVAAAAGERMEDFLVNGYSGYNNEGYYSGKRIAAMVNETKKPSPLLFGLVLAVYVVFAGPVLYLILKKKEKREYIWISVLLVSIVFTGIVYITGSLYRIRRPMVDTFTVIHQEGDWKTEKAYVNITCPKAKQYRVMISDDCTEYGIDSDSYDYDWFAASTKKDGFDFMFYNKNAGTELVINNETAFDTMDFSAGRLSDNDVGQMGLDIHCYTDGFEGSLTNNTVYDLEDVVVFFENCYYLAGDLKRGQTVSIDRNQLITGYPYGTFDNLYSADRNRYDDSSRYMQWQIDNFMERIYANNLENGRGIVWGRVGAYVPELVRDDNVVTSGQAVYLTEFAAEYEDVRGLYCPDISQLEVASSGDYDSGSGLMYTNETIDIAYYLVSGFTELVNLNYGKKPVSDSEPHEYAKVYAYNAETDLYDEIFTDSGILGGVQLEKYLADGVLRLRYAVVVDTTQYKETYMPKIVARGAQ